MPRSAVPLSPTQPHARAHCTARPRSRDQRAGCHGAEAGASRPVHLARPCSARPAPGVGWGGSPTWPGERGFSTGAAGAHRRPAASRSGPSDSHSPPRPARPFGLIHAPAPAPPALCLLPARAAPGRGGPTPTRPHSCALRAPDPGRDPGSPVWLHWRPQPTTQPRPPSALVEPQGCAPDPGLRHSRQLEPLLSGH